MDSAQKIGKIPPLCRELLARDNPTMPQLVESLYDLAGQFYGIDQFLVERMSALERVVSSAVKEIFDPRRQLLDRLAEGLSFRVDGESSFEGSLAAGVVERRCTLFGAQQHILFQAYRDTPTRFPHDSGRKSDQLICGGMRRLAGEISGLADLSPEVARREVRGLRLLGANAWSVELASQAVLEAGFRGRTEALETINGRLGRGLATLRDRCKVFFSGTEPSYQGIQTDPNRGDFTVLVAGLDDSQYEPEGFHCLLLDRPLIAAMLVSSINHALADSRMGMAGGAEEHRSLRGWFEMEADFIEALGTSPLFVAPTFGVRVRCGVAEGASNAPRRAVA